MATWLIRLCSQHDLNGVTRFLQQGSSDVNEKGAWPELPDYVASTKRPKRSGSKSTTALIVAARLGYDAIVDVLLRLGNADANITCCCGSTALYWAVLINHKKIVAMLSPVTGQVEINALNSSGWSSLHAAVNNDNQEILQILLETPFIDANLASDAGETPLTLAASSNAIYLLQVLLSASSVDLNKRNGIGDLAIQVAAKHEHSEAIKIMLPLIDSANDIVDDLKRRDFDAAKFLEKEIRRQQTILSLSSPLKSYPMDPANVGHALIINIEFFETMDRRRGSVRDVELMTEVFESIGLEVTIKPKNFEASKKEFKMCLEAFVKKINHDGDKSMCAVCIMSHGSSGCVFASDGKIIYVEDIFSMFSGKKCPALADKPKFFVIQKCRGKKRQIVAGSKTHKYQRDAMPTKLVKKSVCNNFAIAYATIPDHTSYRHPENGAVFIRSLYKVFMEHSGRCSLQDLLTLTSADLDNFEKPTPKTVEKQTCGVEYRGFSKALFFP